MGKNSIIKVLNTCNLSIYKGHIYAVSKEKRRWENNLRRIIYGLVEYESGKNVLFNMLTVYYLAHFCS